MPSYYDEYHKTPKSKRDTYIYEVKYSDGTVVKITLRPPENEEEEKLVKDKSEAIYTPKYHNEGEKIVESINDKVYVTNPENIHRLHLEDDRIVRQNLKESNPPLSKAEASTLKQWIIKHPEAELPKRRTLSLQAFETNETTDRFLSSNGVYQTDESEEVLLIHITAQSKLNDMQFVIFSMKYKSYSNKEIGAYLGLDESTIRYHVEKIKKILRKEFENF